MWWYRKAGGAKPPSVASLDTPLDELLGHYRRAQFQQLLAQRRYGGRAWQWDDYVRWGQELVHTAQVQRPPVGPAPSVPLAETYRCIHCHNLVREDVVLTRQDPEAREQLLEENPALGGKKTGVRLTTGTTFWGMVNRERFYNGYYAKYHRLQVREGERFRPMDPSSLADAVQVCCSYCSAGRFPEDWELDSILAYLWTLELRLRDLDLPAEMQRRILEQFNSGNPQAVDAARQQLRQYYLVASQAHAVDPPTRSEGDKDTYPPSVAELEQLFAPGQSRSASNASQPASTSRKNLVATGDPKRGEWLYRSACAFCHGNEVHPKAGRSLATSPGTFHRYVWKGTQRDGLYMPFFTRERLSPRQATDIRAYLRSLPPEKKISD
ncbi:MAG: cytochrome c [Gemmatales bacterium]|nr:cytochrome c [Gemmatales bacterium]MDW7993179.1 cytochrome c [Gemmatales bacterium]